MGDRWARAGHRIRTNSHAGAHDDTTAEPDVISDADRLDSLDLLASRLELDRMNRRQQLNVRTDLHVVADSDLGDIEQLV